MYQAAVITISDKGSRGEREDTSGPAVCAIAEEHGFHVVYRSIVPDEQEQIRAELISCADQRKIDLVLTTGGTGFSPRDVTPEATLRVIEKRLPGFERAMTMTSLAKTPRGAVSRAVCGTLGGAFLVNLPGSPKAVSESLDAVLDTFPHALDMLRGSSGDCAR